MPKCEALLSKEVVKYRENGCQKRSPKLSNSTTLEPSGRSFKIQECSRKHVLVLLNSDWPKVDPTNPKNQKKGAQRRPPLNEGSRTKAKEEAAGG